MSEPMTAPAPAPLAAPTTDPSGAPDAPAAPSATEVVGRDAPPSGLVETATTERAFTPDPEADVPVATDAGEPEALVIGEALIDVVRRADGTAAEHPGGSPANVAIGLARLGRAANLLTWFGKDAHGRLLAEHLSASGVTVVPGSDTAGSTSVATATVDAEGVASYDFDLSWHVPAAWASPPTAPVVVHTGSIAAVLEPGGPDVARILEAHRASATITYDPNLRPSLMPPAGTTRPVVEGLVALADVVKVSDEDLAWLEPDEDPLAVARRWATTGPAFVVVTQGGEGAVAVTADGREVAVPAPPVVVADTVGAGDSFMGGLIDGLWSAGLLGAEGRSALHAVDDATLQAVLLRCARIAAITVSRPGANPPTSAELEPED